MANEETGQSAKEERVFLHDISTPIGTSTLIVDLLLSRMKELGNMDDEVAQLEILLRSLERVKSLILDRRKVLINSSDS